MQRGNTVARFETVGENENRNKAMFLNLGLVEMSNCFGFLSHCCGRYTKSSL